MESIGSPALWSGFIAFVLAMLALDLGVFHRHAHVVRVREAAIWSGVWVSLALLFAGGLTIHAGSTVGMEFLTGYLIEKTLSIDNIFIFVVIFSALAIPRVHQHRILFWGILTALVLRAGMIFAGVAALERFDWLVYVFGGFLIFTGIKLFRDWRLGAEAHPEGGAGMRLLRRIVPSTPRFDEGRFFTVENGRRLATPLFMALLLVEATDVIFALDSIPAIFAITRDPFVVFTSNIFAILGLRSLFFLLAGMIEKFHYVKVGLSIVLVFVGVKMAAIDFFHLSPAVSLAIIATILGTSLVASYLHSKRLERRSVPGGTKGPGALP